MWNKHRGLSAAFMLIVSGLSGCETSTNATLGDYCKIYSPILWHRLDTQGTKDQIARENGKFECVCNSNCPKEE